jgi:urease accessory protein
VLLVAPDAESRIDEIRAMLPVGAGLEAGASAFRGMVLVRMLATDGDRLRPGLCALLARLGDGPLPRVWQV